MDWFALVFTMRGANQLRSLFEENVPAHHLYGAAFSPIEDVIATSLPRSFAEIQCRLIQIGLTKTAFGRDVDGLTVAHD
jgi:hypothetical protein